MFVQRRSSGACTVMCGQGWTFRERCENYLGCEMSGHLDLLCVREQGNGCGYKISSRPLARITT